MSVGKLRIKPVDILPQDPYISRSIIISDTMNTGWFEQERHPRQAR